MSLVRCRLTAGRVFGALVVGLSALALAVPAAGAATGDLTFGSCVTAASVAGCQPDSAVAAPRNAAFAPDGMTLYLADGGATTSPPTGTAAGNLAVFTRAADGTLQRTACLNGDGSGGCTMIAGLQRPSAVAVSPDGQTIYIADAGLANGDGGLITLQRGPGAGFTEIGCRVAQASPPAPCTQDATLAAADAVSVSADGTSLFVATGFGGRSDNYGLLAFSTAARAPAPTVCFGATTGCSGTVINDASNMTMDAAAAGTLLVGGYTVSRYDRGPDGALTADGCLGFSASACATKLPGSTSYAVVTLSPDGTVLYLTDSQENGSFRYGVRSYRLGTGDGVLESCLVGSNVSPVPAGCTSSVDSTLAFIGSAVLSPDGVSAYVASSSGFVDTLRRAADGSLTEAGCQDLSDALGNDCEATSGNGGLPAVVSPDGAALVVTSAMTTDLGALARFARAQPPTVTSGTVSGVGSTTATITPRVDPDGAATTVTARYGPTTGYGATSGPVSVPVGYTPAAVPVTLTGLTAATTYHYAITATSAGGTATSTDGTFTTAPAATAMTTTTATTTTMSTPPPPTRSRPPRLTALRITPSTFHLHGRRVHGRRVPTAARAAYRDSQRAASAVTIARLATGVRRGRRCVAAPKHRTQGRPRRCTRVTIVARLRHRDGAGVNAIRLTKGSGRGVGRYRLQISAVNGSGQRSNTVTGTFRIAA